MKTSDPAGKVLFRACLCWNDRYYITPVLIDFLNKNYNCARRYKDHLTATSYCPIIVLLAYIVATIQQMHEWGGWLLALFFFSLAIAFRSHPFLKGFTFTVIILAVVSLAMYYPHYFQTIGDVKTPALIIPAMQVIMFGMGTELSLKDFVRFLRMPKGVISEYLYSPACHS